MGKIVEVEVGCSECFFVFVLEIEYEDGAPILPMMTTCPDCGSLIPDHVLLDSYKEEMWYDMEENYGVEWDF